MTDSPSELEPPPSSAPSLAMWLAFVVMAAAILGIWMARNTRPARPAPSGLVGLPAPDIQVEGWLNGPGPTPEELQGKVVLLDAWAYWCGPCLQEAPHLRELHAKYQDRVVFLGLTAEDSSTLDQSRRFLEVAKLPWPQGYGANDTLTELRAYYIPQLYLIGRDGRIAWDSTSDGTIEEAIERTLATDGPNARD